MKLAYLHISNILRNNDNKRLYQISRDGMPVELLKLQAKHLHSQKFWADVEVRDPGLQDG